MVVMENEPFLDTGPVIAFLIHPLGTAKAHNFTCTSFVNMSFCQQVSAQNCALLSALI